MDRRAFLASMTAIPCAARAAFAVAGSRSRRLLQVNGYPINAETPLDTLTTYLTPNELFFIRHHWNPTIPDPKRWSLTVDGDVARPLRLTLADLKRLPRTTVTCVLQCAGNGRALHEPKVPGLQWHHGAVGNARWTGVPVKTLLDQAGLKPGSAHLHTFGSDQPPGKVPPFHRSLELDKAFEDAIVAFEMNGEPLPALHGAPARVVVPGWAGDHWMKWLVRLSVRPEPQTGFYMDVAYRWPNSPGEPGVALPPEQMHPLTELRVKSKITEAPSLARVGAPVAIRGFAFSGAPDIAKVEVSDDGGQTWAEARLELPHDPYAWRLWSYAWTPRATGRVKLYVRATDSRGSLQPKEAIWNQSGYLYNAWDSLEIEVKA